ncbi:hypothetical protein [Winogradskyella aurantia]|nr:hypothetical protein [Winogradskyella aurantia]
MKKITLLLLFVLMFATTSMYSQARTELNFGIIGANYEIPVSDDITIAPFAGTNLDLDWLTLGVKANYYFDNLFDLTDDAWDVYGGAGAGYAFYNGDGNDDNDLDIGLHVGGRWFWNDKWGIYLEFGGGNTQGATGGLGLTVKL